MTRKNVLCTTALCAIALLLIVLTTFTFASAASNSSPLSYDNVNLVYVGTMQAGDVTLYRNLFTDSYCSNFLVDGYSETLYSESGYEGNYKDLMISLNGSRGYNSNYYDGTNTNPTLSVGYIGTVTGGTYYGMMTNGTNSSARNLEGYTIWVEKYYPDYN